MASVRFLPCGTASGTRDRKQLSWSVGDTGYCCYKCFGMGIDKPDPFNTLGNARLHRRIFPEAAGRDDNKASAVLLYARSVRAVLKNL